MPIHPVFLGVCPSYNTDQIDDLLQAALKEVPLKKQIRGNVVIKPNLVMAHPKIATDGYTRKEIIESIIRLIERSAHPVKKIDIVEKAGLGVTTASMYQYAGYKALLKKHPVKLRSAEEIKLKLVALDSWHIHPHLHIPREMAECDFLIFAPKLKTNVLSQGFSGALKLNIGTIDSKERMYHHHRDLHKKIVDILEVVNPDLIITDGIRMAYGGNQMTQQGIDLGVVVVANNALAHDMVCAKLLNLDPLNIGHIREAIERGHGPESFKDIKISGNYDMAAAHQKIKNLDFGYYPVQDFPKKHPCNLKIIPGKPYCTGGCQGIFLDWLHMIKDRGSKLLKRFPKMTVVIGKTMRPISDKNVLLIGRCAQASPNISAKRIVRINGCPPTHKRIVLDMMVHFRLLAPLVRPSLIWDGFIMYPLKKLKGWLVNLV